MAMLLATATMDAGPWAEAFRRRALGRELYVHGVDDFPREAIRYALAWNPSPGALRGLPGLEVIFNLGAGVDALLEASGGAGGGSAHGGSGGGGGDLPEVPLVRLVDPKLTTRMTEWVSLAVLTHHRQALAYMRQQARREWRPLPQPVAGEVRVGIMGYGALGADAAAVLGRLGFAVHAWSRTAKPEAPVKVLAGAGELGRFLGRTDILVCLLPLTAETRGILDAALIGRLARDGVLGGPVLINAGRGGLQVAADIDRALREGTLAGASLDVFEHEPLGPDSPLWDSPNLVVTPHVAADSDPDTASAIVLDQIDRYERGEPLQHVVDRTRGY